MNTEFLNIIPVLPSADIQRDIQWYEEKAGFELHSADEKYAILFRDKLWIHLQWHAGTPEDPLLGGSVIRINVRNIAPLFEEFVRRGTITRDAFRKHTPWNTSEFGFYDLNKNAVFVMEDR